MTEEASRNEASALSLRRVAVRGVEAAALGLVLANVASALGRVHWLLELSTHFVHLYAAAGVVVVLLARLLNARRSALVLVAVVTLVAGVRTLVVYWPAAADHDPEAPSVDLLVANVERVNTERGAFGEVWAAFDPDIVALVEPDDAWLRDLEPWASAYPHQVAVTNELNLGLAVYSRHPIVAVDEVPVSGELALPARGAGRDDVLWALDLQLDVDGERVRLIVVHAYPPVSGELSALRDAVLVEVAERAAASEVPVIVAGDFNAAPWSPIFADVLEIGGLADSRQGFGIHGTWGPGASIPIDHVVHSDELVTLDRAIGDAFGSDHRPVWVRLAWTR